MSNLDNLLKKITDNGNEKASQIIKEAEAKAALVTDAKMKEAEREKERILDIAQNEAQRSKDTLISGKRLEIRDKLINAKRGIIDKVFDDALNRLNGISYDDFIKYIVDCLKSSEINGQAEILLPEKYLDIDLNYINETLNQSGKPVNLTKGLGHIDKSGFMLRSGGVEQNQTFEALLMYMRDALEAEVIAELF